MKSIQARKKADQRIKSNTQLMGMIMLTVMFVSIAGFAFLSGGGGSSGDYGENEEHQEGHLGFSDQGFWVANIGGNLLGFTNSPDQIGNVSLNIDVSINDYVGQGVYYSKGQELGTEITRAIGPFVGNLQEACLGECEENLPERTCEDRMIIWNQEIDGNEVRQEENCIFIDGDLRAVDAFLYELLGL